MTRYLLCHYVRVEDQGDLLWGFLWRKAVLVDDGTLVPGRHETFERNMFDYDTGENVGDTRNYCVSPSCIHEDCGPMTLIAEVD